MEKGVISERVITVGYNGPTKFQCDSRGNVEKYIAKFVKKSFSQREERIYGIPQ